MGEAFISRMHGELTAPSSWDGLTESTAAPTVKALSSITSTNGLYWIKPYETMSAVKAYIDFTTHSFPFVKYFDAHGSTNGRIVQFFEDNTNSDGSESFGGTVSGEAYSTDCIIGTKAIEFGYSTSDYLKYGTGHAWMNDLPFSLSVWAKPTDATRGINSRWRTYGHGTEIADGGSGKQFRAWFNSSTSNSYDVEYIADTSATDTWVHFAFFFGTTESRLYLNGALVDTQTYGSCSLYSGSDGAGYTWMNDGAANIATGAGLLDACYIFSDELTEDQNMILYTQHLDESEL